MAGSLREGSYNKLLAKIAAEAARKAGADVNYIDLKEYPMPIYDQDDEDKNGLPENAKKLKELFMQSHGLIIASPEYNSSISAVLKNTIDWLSRQAGDAKALAAFDGKVAGLLSASPSGFGGVRGLSSLRSILGNIKVTVLPDQVTVSQAFDAFDEEGMLKDAGKLKLVSAVGVKVFEFSKRLNS